jgi:diguanylate cyclase (GGDEF)-like protein
MAESIQSLKRELLGLQKKYQQIEETNLKLNEKLLEMYSLYKISLALSATFDLQHVLKATKDFFQATFPVDQFSLMLFDEKFETLCIHASVGLSESTVEVPNYFHPNSVFYQVSQDARALYLNDLSLGIKQSIYPENENQTGSFLSLPLIAIEQQSIGLLNISRRKTDGFSKHDISLLTTISDQIAKVIDKSLLFHHTRELSITDELTGIYNRRYFNQRYEREILRAKRYDRAATVVMIDIDHFKIYNDTHGHLKGDELLKEFSGLLDSIIRKADILARYGGEEFVLILPEIDKKKAIQAAEKFRKTIEKHQFPGGDSQPNGKLSISLGLATYPTDAGDAKALLDVADKSLYAVKSTVRNAVGYVNPEANTFQIHNHNLAVPNLKQPVPKTKPSLTALAG